MRIIKTVEELQKLTGADTVLRDANGSIFERNHILRNPTDYWCERPGYEGYLVDSAIDLPATIIWPVEP